MNKEDLKNRFTFHPAAPDQAPRYEAIRARALELAQYVDELAPDGREKSLAVTHLEEVVFWANAAIARGEPHYNGGDNVQRFPFGPEPKGEPPPKGEDVATVERVDDVPAPPTVDELDAGDGDDELEPAADVRPCPECNGKGCRRCFYSGRAR